MGALALLMEMGPHKNREKHGQRLQKRNPSLNLYSCCDIDILNSHDLPPSKILCHYADMRGLLCVLKMNAKKHLLVEPPSSHVHLL